MLLSEHEERHGIKYIAFLLSLAEKLLFRKGDVVIALSKEMRKLIVKKFKHP